IVFSIQSVFNASDMKDSVTLNYRFSLLIQAISPLLLLLIGMYLLRGGQGIVNLAFRKQKHEKLHHQDIFFLFMKIAGLGLLIVAIPDVFQIISDGVFASVTHSY